MEKVHEQWTAARARWKPPCPRTCTPAARRSSTSRSTPPHAKDAKSKLAPRMERLKAEFRKNRDKLADYLEADLEHTKEDMKKLGEATSNTAKLAKEKLMKKYHELTTKSEGAGQGEIGRRDGLTRNSRPTVCWGRRRTTSPPTHGPTGPPTGLDPASSLHPRFIRKSGNEDQGPSRRHPRRCACTPCDEVKGNRHRRSSSASGSQVLDSPRSCQLSSWPVSARLVDFPGHAFAVIVSSLLVPIYTHDLRAGQSLTRSRDHSDL